MPAVKKPGTEREEPPLSIERKLGEKEQANATKRQGQRSNKKSGIPQLCEVEDPENQHRSNRDKGWPEQDRELWRKQRIGVFISRRMHNYVPFVARYDTRNYPVPLAHPVQFTPGKAPEVIQPVCRCTNSVS